MRATFGDSLIVLKEKIEHLVVLDGDNATSTKTDLFATQHPQSFFNVGIAEQNLVSVAAGLALAGCRPVVCAFASMLVNRALDQITHSVAYQNLGVVLVGHYAGISGSREGACHHSISDIAALRGIPHLTLLAPACDGDTEPLLHRALTSGTPHYVRLSRETFADLPVPDSGGVAAGWRYWGPPEPEVVVVAAGTTSSLALEALELVRPRTGVFNPLVLSPFPYEALGMVAERARALVTVEEHSLRGGVGSTVAEWTAEHGGPKCRRIGLPHEFTVSGSYSNLMTRYGLTPQSIASAVNDIGR
ncbi:transketolase family protein [Streptomyces sp. NPDC088554]|uniref:transketolase family protein n=1 Tax=Streptomyces sp. NPDC088554 TaxID=3365865 RepID=UPI00381AD103